MADSPLLPSEVELDSAKEAFEQWLPTHRLLDVMCDRTREIFYHGYFARLREERDGDS